MSEQRRDRDMEFHSGPGAFTVESVGPFERYPAVVNGWSVPRLEIRQMKDHVEFFYDGRFGLDVPTDLATGIGLFIADVIAVERGYACHPRKPRDLTAMKAGEAPDFPPRLSPWRAMTPLGAVYDGPVGSHDHSEDEAPE